MKEKFRFDISIFEKVHSDTTPSDRRSLLAVQAALRSQINEYVYLELGSYKGGSLQPYLIDEKCKKIYSIDNRVDSEVDERGEKDFFFGNTTRNMLLNLRKYYDNLVSKITTIDGSSETIKPFEVFPKADLLFIDAEHTDKAVFEDFQFCLKVSKKKAVIMIHDVNMTIEGFGKCCTYLEKISNEFNAYVLPSTLGVIELGGISIYKHPSILDRLRKSYQSYVFGVKSLSAYRDFYKNYYMNPLFSFIIRGFGRLKAKSIDYK